MQFSIIIPTYNRAKFIEKTIQSVLNQDFLDFEIIIIDDGSTDHTEELIKSINDPRIRYYYKINEERGVARNFGVKRAQGDYITFLDSDDLIYPNHFSEAKKIIETYPQVDIFHLAYEVRNIEGKLLRKESNRKGRTLNDLLINGNHLSCIGVFIKREIALINPFKNDRQLIASEDWELWLRMASRYDIFYSNTITGCMIDHSYRSLNIFDLGKYLYCTELLLLYLRSDDPFMEKYGHRIHEIESEMVSLMALNLAIERNNSLSFSFFVEAVSINYKELFKRRALAILKIYFKNLFRKK